jgi:hypothetical protein
MGVSGLRHAPATLYPRCPLDRRLGGPQSRSGLIGQRKNFCLCRESNLDSPVVQTIARHYTDCATPAPHGSLIATLILSCNLCLELSNRVWEIYRLILTQHG